jgi:hypothetical protein
MKFRRGFFRLWAITSAIFVVAAGIVSFRIVQGEFARLYSFPIPTLCGEAQRLSEGKAGRGELGKDYSVREGALTIGSTGKLNPFETCWYPYHRFRALYPEQNAVGTKELIRKQYREMAKPLNKIPAPWSRLITGVSIALGVPVAILALVSALTWAFAGFSRSQRAA